MSPSYNQAAYLEQTITSVLEQDYPRLEYLVVDGASTDGSVEIIKKYAGKLAFWVSERDSGQAEAINKGLSRAKGEILAWLNSDDYYLPGTISAVVKTFQENSDVVLIYGNMLAVDENGDTINVLKYNQLTLEDLLCFQIIGQPAVFFRREAFEKAGDLDTTYHFLLDHHLWLRIALQGRILHVDETWSAARYHSEAKNRRQSRRVWTRSLPYFGLGQDSAWFSGSSYGRGKTRARICISCGCPLSTGWWSGMEITRILVSCVIHPSADSFGTFEYPCFHDFASDRTWPIA